MFGRGDVELLCGKEEWEGVSAWCGSRCGVL